jgi:hypothetical protein
MPRAGAFFGMLFIAACSVDHLVVAALDDAGPANEGGAVGSAGTTSGSTAGKATWVGSPGQGGMDRIILIASGGGNVDVRIGAGASGGPPTAVLCACEDEQASLCGSDGLTYPTPCEDGGTCAPPSIACFHACPCLEGESASIEVTSWFPSDCDPATRCSGDVMCLTFGNVTTASQKCATPSN